MTGDRNPGPEDAVPLPIDGILDLHAFSPKDVKDLVPDYIAECLAAGILDLRIIHGKGLGVLRNGDTCEIEIEGIGVLRTIVQEILAGHPAVESFGHPCDGGSWGATVVRLRDPRALNEGRDGR